MLEIQTGFEIAVANIGDRPSEQLDDEMIEALKLIRQKTIKTIIESRKGNLPSIHDRLEFITQGELDELSKYLHLDQQVLLEIRWVKYGDTVKSPIFEYIGDPEKVGIRKFKQQPVHEPFNLVMVCVEMPYQEDFAVGLVTQQELDLLSLNLDDKE